MKITPAEPIDFEVNIRLNTFEALAFYRILRSIGGAPEGVRGIFNDAENKLGLVLGSRLGGTDKVADVVDELIEYEPSGRSVSIYFNDASRAEVEKKVRAALNLPVDV
jgi:hypothetical protein